MVSVRLVPAGIVRNGGWTADLIREDEADRQVSIAGETAIDSAGVVKTCAVPYGCRRRTRRQHITEVHTMIRAQALTKRYGSTVAVDHLDFEIQPGVVTGFLGPNGAGKTTTMRLILGLDNPTSGTVTVNGRRYADVPYPLHEVGALLDAKAVHPSRNAYNHLLALAKSNRISPKRVATVLEMVGLNEVARRPVGKFSLGMNQRLGIAAAMLGDPPILMFDEPVNGLDPEGIMWIRNLLKHLANEGRTIFLSSHLMSEMAQTADQLIVIGRGKLIAAASVAEVVAGGGGSVFVQTPHLDKLAEVLRGKGAKVSVVDGAADEAGLDVTGLDARAVGELAFANGIVVHQLVRQRESLEDAYFRLTDDSVEYHAAALAGAGQEPS